MLDITGLDVTYDAATPSRAVRDLSLSIGSERRCGLVGESGSGKSTVIKAILGLLRPPHRSHAERIDLAGIGDLSKMSQAELRHVRGHDIGYVGQNPFGALHPVVRIGRQFEGFLRDHGAWEPDESPGRIIDTLTGLGIADPERVLAGSAGELSGGMAQRVVIALASLLGPRLLVADEPTTALDVTVQRQVLELIAGPRAGTGTALLLVTHDLAVVAQYCDDVIVMQRGVIVERGLVDDVLTDPQHPYTASLLASVPRLPVPDAAIDTAIDLVDPGDRAVASTGHTTPLHATRLDTTTLHATARGPSGPSEDPARRQPVADRPAVRHEPTVILEDLAKTYRGGGGAVDAVRGVDLTVGRAETVALIGESGSGKSTLGRLALMLERSDRGRVVLEGEELTGLGPKALRRLRPRMQIVFQEPYQSLNPQLRVKQSIAEPLGNLRPRPGREEIRRRVNEALELAGLDVSKGERYPQQLSGGEQQRVGIARAIVTRPSFVVLDEPTSSLDLTVRLEILRQLQRLQSELHMSYLFISHDLATARLIAQRVYVMYRGRIVEHGTAAELFAAPRHPYTRILNEACLDPDPRRRSRPMLRNEPVLVAAGEPDPCSFLDRCGRATEECRVSPRIAALDHDEGVACWHPVTGAVPARPVAEEARR
jgi:peptide/nickel transport system ATP-binding protein